MRSHRCFTEDQFSGGKIIFRDSHRVDFGTPIFQESHSTLTWSIFLFHMIHKATIQCIHGLEPDGRLRLFLTHLNILLFLYVFQCSWYLKDLSIRNITYFCRCEGVYATWISDIRSLRIYVRLMVTRRGEWGWRVFVRPGWGDVNDENP